MPKSNLLKGIIGQALVILTGLATVFIFTPYLLSKIGAKAYAFYPLSFNIVNYASVFTILFTSVLSKFIAVDYYRGNFRRMNGYFNSSLKGNLIIGLVIGIPMLFGSLFIDRFFDIPGKLADEVKILFVTVTLSFFIIQIRNTFTVSHIVTGRRYIITYIKLLEKLMNVIIPVIIFIILPPSVMYLGIGVLISQVIRFYITVKSQRKIMPELRVDRKLVYKELTKALLTGGIWYSLNQLIVLLNSGVEVVISNIIFGAEVQAEYSLSVVLPNLVRSMVIFIANLILPYLSLLLKNEGEDYMKKTVPLLVKYMSVLMGTVLSLIIGFGDAFLKVWLLSFTDESMYLLLVLSSLSVFVTGSFSILSGVLVVQDRLRFPTAVMIILGVLNIPFGFLLSKIFGIYGILISSLVVNIIGYVIFIPFYSFKVLKLDKKEIRTSFLKGVYTLILGTGLSILVKLILKPYGIVKLVFGGVISLLLIIMIIFLLILKKKDIEIIKNTVAIALEYKNEIV